MRLHILMAFQKMQTVKQLKKKYLFCFSFNKDTNSTAKTTWHKLEMIYWPALNGWYS